MTPEEQERLRNRCLAGQDATETIKFLEEMGKDSTAPEYFWQLVRDFVVKKVPAISSRVEKVVPFTDKEADRFGREEMPFGEFQGKFVRDVPVERLDWYVSSDEDLRDFRMKLRKYVTNENVRRRLAESFYEADE